MPRIGLAGRWTPTLAWIVALNVACFLLQAALPPFTGMLALVPGRVWPDHLHTLLTYAFLHGGVGHLFFNMLTLYFFAGDLELFMGTRRFLTLYFGSALFGGMAAALFLEGPVLLVGASGAVYGVLTAYALYFPSTEVLLWFLLPVKIWALVLVWILLSLFYSVFGSSDGIAHLAHLGGAVFALLYILEPWNPRGALRDFAYRWRRRRFRRIQ